MLIYDTINYFYHFKDNILNLLIVVIFFIKNIFIQKSYVSALNNQMNYTIMNVNKIMIYVSKNF